jgi:hypothetical protein
MAETVPHRPKRQRKTIPAHPFFLMGAGIFYSLCFVRSHVFILEDNSFIFLNQ